jgi:hypothetical protein
MLKHNSNSRIQKPSAELAAIESFEGQNRYPYIQVPVSAIPDKYLQLLFLMVKIGRYDY